MADFANMNVSTDNEVSVYDTPDTTLVIDGSFDDSLNMNTSLIQAEQGKFSSRSFSKTRHFLVSFVATNFTMIWELFPSSFLKVSCKLLWSFQANLILKSQLV